MFVALEGIDGSGKTTQAGLLARALGPDTVLVREPGGSEPSERIRELLADPEVALGPLGELLLFCAARAELVERVIRPAIASGRDVVSDRFSDSTLAYQGVARELGIEAVEAVNRVATGGLEPDLTVVLAVDPERTAERRPLGDDRHEREGVDFQRTVAAAYEEIARRHAARIAVVDGEGTVDEVHERVMAAVGARRPAREPQGSRG